MASTAYINIIGTRCHPQDEARFNKWYNEIHIPMLMKIKGLKAITRYKLTNDDPKYPAYLAIYEFGSKEDLDAYQKSPELAAVRDEMKQSWPDPASAEITWRALYQELKSFKR